MKVRTPKTNSSKGPCIKRQFVEDLTGSIYGSNEFDQSRRTLEVSTIETSTEADNINIINSLYSPDNSKPLKAKPRHKRTISEVPYNLSEILPKSAPKLEHSDEELRRPGLAGSSSESESSETELLIRRIIAQRERSISQPNYTIEERPYSEQSQSEDENTLLDLEEGMNLVLSYQQQQERELEHKRKILKMQLLSMVESNFNKLIEDNEDLLTSRQDNLLRISNVSNTTEAGAGSSIYKTYDSSIVQFESSDEASNPCMGKSEQMSGNRKVIEALLESLPMPETVDRARLVILLNSWTSSEHFVVLVRRGVEFGGLYEVVKDTAYRILGACPEEIKDVNIRSRLSFDPKLCQLQKAGSTRLDTLVHAITLAD
jgi:hypothetical protein